MPSGRKNRSSRHRSHKQQQKQKLDESADRDPQPNLRHGPLPDSDSSSWMMEPLPPQVEGPSLLKQDAENADSSLRGIHRKIQQDVPFPSKRKKAAVDTNAKSSSLDRWDGGDFRVDETLSPLDSMETQSQLREFKSSKLRFDNLDMLDNGFGLKDEFRKGKGRAPVVSGNRASTEIDALGTGHVEASLSDSKLRLKDKVSHRRGLLEHAQDEIDDSIQEADSNFVEFRKEQNLGPKAVEPAKTSSRKDGSTKRWDKDASRRDSDVVTRISVDTQMIQLERKQGKMGDLSANSSPKSRHTDDVLKSRRSEGLQRSQKSRDVKFVDSDDAEPLEERLNVSHDAGKGSAGSKWMQQDDYRNVDLEKELESRIQHQREDSGDRDRYRDDDKQRDARRHHYQKEEQFKQESRYRFEKYKGEAKVKDDGGKSEKDRSDSRHRDEINEESRHVEDKHKEEKQRPEKDREERRKDHKEGEEKHKYDRDREERSYDDKHMDDKHKEEQRKEVKGRDTRNKEDKSRDDRYRVEKNNEDRQKDEKDREEWLKDETLRGQDNFECHKDGKDCGGRFQDETDKRRKQGDRDDRLKDKDKGGRIDKFKEEKSKCDREKVDKHREESDREVVKDEKGKYVKRRIERDQVDITIIDKLQGERHKGGKQQYGTDKDDRLGDDRERNSRQREERVKNEKLQDPKYVDGRDRYDFNDLDKPGKLLGEREKHERDKAHKDIHDRQWDDKDEKYGDETLGCESYKGEKDVEKDDGLTGQDKQEVGSVKLDERFDVSRGDSKQNDAWTRDNRHPDLGRHNSSSHDELFRQSKDLGEPRGTNEQEARDRKGFEKHDGDKRVTKISRDGSQDQESALSLLATSRAMDTLKSEYRPKRARDMGMVDAVIAERDFARPRGRQGEVENDFSREDRMLRRVREGRSSPYDALPRSPSPSLPDGSYTTSFEKAARRSKFETNISISSNSGTWRPRERNRHMTEHIDRVKQHHVLEEEVKSWEPRVPNQDSDDEGRRSLSPERNQDLPPSHPSKGCPVPVQEELRGPLRGSMRFEDSVVLEREHRRFSQGGGPSKYRRLDDASWDRTEWLHQGPHMNRPPMGGAPMVRPQSSALPNRASGPSGLLPPPPPFRPGIDNPAILGTSNNFEEGSGPREIGRYDRKSGGTYKRSEIAGPGDTWRGFSVGNWNAQNLGPGPANMFSPFPQIGAHPSGGFLGMGQQFPVQPLFGPSNARPSADMSFGGARFHMGDGGVRFPGHAPNRGTVMGWNRSAEADESFCPPPPDLLEGHGPYTDEWQRLGRPEWDQGARVMPGQAWERVPNFWQGQVGDADTGYKPPHFQNKASYQGSLGEEVSTSHHDGYNNEQKDPKVPHNTSPASVTNDARSAVPLTELKSSKRAVARMQPLLLSVNISAKLASSDLYKQYLSLLPPEEAKIREPSVPDHRDDSSVSLDEDFEFELDSEAQDLLASPAPYPDLLLSLPGSAYKEALEAYHRPVRENGVQKSVFGHFMLPVDSLMIKIPNVEVRLVDERDDMESVPDQALSPNENLIDEYPFAVNNDNAVDLLKSANKSVCEGFDTEVKELVQDNEGLVSLDTIDCRDRDVPNIDLVGNHWADISDDAVSVKQGGESVAMIYEDGGKATCSSEIALKTTSISVSCDVHTRCSLVESSPIVGTFLETPTQNSNIQQAEETPQVFNFGNSPSLAERVTPEVALLAISLETFSGSHISDTLADARSVQAVTSIDWPISSQDGRVDSHPAEHHDTSQRVEGDDLDGQLLEDDGVGSGTSVAVNDSRSEGGEIVLEAGGEIEMDDMKSNYLQSPEKVSENTH